jgi:hypothetical protein
MEGTGRAEDSQGGIGESQRALQRMPASGGTASTVAPSTRPLGRRVAQTTTCHAPATEAR